MIVEGALREEVLAIRQLSYSAYRESKEVGIIATNETLRIIPRIVKNIGTRDNDKTIARNLYAVLREFDEENGKRFTGILCNPGNWQCNYEPS